MSELEEKLEGILGNPQAMAQIMSLAQSLSSGGASQQSGAQESPANEPASAGAPAPLPEAQPASSAAPPSLGGLGSLFSGLNSLDPQMLSAAANLMGQFTSGEDDKRTALLTALRPFVKEQRYAKLDKAIQIAKLSRLIRSGLELLRARKEEDGHV